PEPVIGAPTADEEIAQQTALHEWLMQEMPDGVLSAPITVRLTDLEKSDLKKRQEAGTGGPAVVGRTKGLGVEVRFSGVDAALLTASPGRVANGLLRSTSDGRFVWAAAVQSQDRGPGRGHS